MRVSVSELGQGFLEATLTRDTAGDELRSDAVVADAPSFGDDLLPVVRVVDTIDGTFAFVTF